MRRRGAIALGFGGAIALGLVGLWLWRAEGPAEPASGFPSTPGADGGRAEDAEYVGRARCGECHPAELDASRGSDHDRAMQSPRADTVLAPFEGERFERGDFNAIFRRDGDAYLVHTADASGAPRDFRVARTFGAWPLQQYLLDVGGGRLQAFTVAWDARPPPEGGRYFDLEALDRAEPGDRHHWTGARRRWNDACADCHSTSVRKGYDGERDRYETTFAEEDVGCEACHGPGSAHVAWAEAGAAGASRGLVSRLTRAPPWRVAEGEASASPRELGDGAVEIAVCAACHAKRDRLVEAPLPGAPFLDAYRPELLSRRLYHHDGQIDDEVYVYGSFLQSRMFHAGVRCSDCHDPHTLELRREGDTLCAGCHAERVFARPAHHRHEGVGLACVDCHMPAKTYMEIDPRRDHSIRIPRPDLGATLGVPDPCTACHESRGSSWAADRITEWFGRERPSHFATVLHAARRRDADAAQRIRALIRDRDTPAIARGTAVVLLDDFPGPTADEALHEAARSEEPLIRLGAAYGARELEPDARSAHLLPLLHDPYRAIRVEAARTLAIASPTNLEPRDREARSAALAELFAAERLHGDQPDAWLRMGLIDIDRGRLGEAERALRTALRRDSTYTPAMVSLAEVRQLRGDEREAEALLRRAIRVDALDAEALHALGLLLVRAGHAEDAVPLLGRAAEVRPDDPRFHYVFAVALHDTGDRAGALRALERGLDAHPNDAQMRDALATYLAE